MTATAVGINAVVGFAYTVAAARQDATPHQLTQLRKRIVPLLKSNPRLLVSDPQRLTDELADIMGPDWKPSGQWAQGVANPMAQVETEARMRGVDLGRFGLSNG